MVSPSAHEVHGWRRQFACRFGVVWYVGKVLELLAGEKVKSVTALRRRHEIAPLSRRHCAGAVYRMQCAPGNVPWVSRVPIRLCP